jgi:hypothetical protein
MIENLIVVRSCLLSSDKVAGSDLIGQNLLHGFLANGWDSGSPLGFTQHSISSHGMESRNSPSAKYHLLRAPKNDFLKASSFTTMLSPQRSACASAFERSMSIPHLNFRLLYCALTLQSCSASFATSLANTPSRTN